MESFYGCECLEIFEPRCCGGGLEILERSIHHRLRGCGVGIIVGASPCGVLIFIVFFLLLNAPSGAFARSALGVVEEGERGLVGTHLHIGFWSRNFRLVFYLLGEISRFGIRHRHIRLTFIVSHCTLEGCAVFEHIIGIFAVPCLVANDTGEFGAPIEHSAHIRHLRDVEVREVERFQARATIEH